MKNFVHKILVRTTGSGGENKEVRSKNAIFIFVKNRLVKNKILIKNIHNIVYIRYSFECILASFCLPLFLLEILSNINNTTLV